MAARPAMPAPEGASHRCRPVVSSVSSANANYAYSSVGHSSAASGECRREFCCALQRTLFA